MEKAPTLFIDSPTSSPNLFSLFWPVLPFILMFMSSITDESMIFQNGYSLPDKLSKTTSLCFVVNLGQIGRAYGVTVFITVSGCCKSFDYSLCWHILYPGLFFLQKFLICPCSSICFPFNLTGTYLYLVYTLRYSI